MISSRAITVAISAACLGGGALAASLTAGPELIRFREGFEKGMLYSTLDRHDTKQYRELYATPEAVKAVREGRPIPRLSSNAKKLASGVNAQLPRAPEPPPSPAQSSRPASRRIANRRRRDPEAHSYATSCEQRMQPQTTSLSWPRSRTSMDATTCWPGTAKR